MTFLLVVKNFQNMLMKILYNMQDNIFDAPIPGESLTDTPGNASWEHPPQFTNVNEAAEHIWDKLHDRNLLQQVITL